MTPEQKQRIEQIEARLAAHRQEVVKYQSHEWAKEGVLRYFEAPDDIDLLLSLVKSQEAASANLCVCGHSKGVHQVFIDHDECRGCWGIDEPCSEFRPSKIATMNKIILGSDVTDAALDVSCPKCGGTKPTCCSCPPAPITEQAQEVIDRWLVDRRLLDQAFVTMQDRQVLAERVTQSINNAATSMRSACVEKVREKIADLSRTSIAAEQNAVELRTLYALHNELESLSIEKPSP